MESAKRIHPEIPPDIPLKQSFYIEDYWPGSVLNSAYPKAIVFPEPRLEKPGTPTLIEAVSPAEGLRRLVELNWPDRLPWGFNGFFDMMRDLAERTPCYTIRWGDSLEDVPGKIGELLGGRVEGWGDGMGWIQHAVSIPCSHFLLFPSSLSTSSILFARFSVL